MVHDADVFMLLSDPQQRVTYTQQTSGLQLYDRGNVTTTIWNGMISFNKLEMCGKCVQCAYSRSLILFHFFQK